MALGATVSDLHLFSHHSRPERYLDRIQAAVRKADMFVLNGDIFDFKWSRHGVFSHTVDEARHFLESLLQANSDCCFHVTLGNHDAIPQYIRLLQELSQIYENMEWQEFVHREQDRLFLHGDAIHGGNSNESLRRFRGRLHRPAHGHPIQRLAHSAVHRSHLPWVAFRMLPKRILAVRILAYLHNENWLTGNKVRHIYFGHTHSDFEDFSFRGFRFHNCGSATQGARLRIVTFPLA